MRTAHLRLHSVAPVLLLALVTALLGQPPSAGAQNGVTQLGIQLAGISPRMGPGPGQELQAQLRVHNPLPDVVRISDVRLDVHPRLNDRGDLASVVSGRGGRGVLRTTSAAFPPVAIPGGGSVLLPKVTFHGLTSLGNGLAGAVLPITFGIVAEVLSPAGYADGLATGTFESFAIFVSEKIETPVRLSLLAPLFEPTHRDPSGTFVDDILAKLLGRGGAISSYVSTLAGHGSRVVTLVVDGMVLEDARAMAAGYRVRDGDVVESVPASDARAEAARRFLSTARTAATSRGMSLVSMPYGNADLAALTRYGLEGDAYVAEQQGRAVVQAGLGATTDDTLAWPTAGAADARTLTTLANAGIREVVLDPRFLKGSTSLTPNAPVPLSPGQPEYALAPDPGLSKTLSDPHLTSAPIAWRQRVLAETAMVWLERPSYDQPRGVLLAPPQSWLPSGQFLAPLLEALSSAPWLRPEPAGGLADSVAPSAGGRILGPYAAADTARELPRDYLDAVKSARGQLRSFRSAIQPDDTGTAGLARTFDQRLLVAESSAWRSPNARPRGRAYLTAVTSGIGAVFRSIVIVQHQVTLTSRDARIPVTVFNNGDRPLTMVIHLERSVNVEFTTTQGSTRFVLAPHTGHTESVRVRTRTTGNFPMSVQVLTPDGQTVITLGTVIVQSTAFNRVALTLTGGAALFLVVWWGAGRRRRLGHSSAGPRGRARRA